MTNQEKIIYDILCSDEQPPGGQHWEGFVASKIAAALAQPEPWVKTYSGGKPNYTQPNEFNPDWNAMAAMVDEQQRMAKRIEELESALAQPEQEPFVWMYQDKSTNEVRFQKHMRAFVDHGATHEMPLYTAPPQREVYCGCGDEIVAGDGARCGTCVAVKYKEKERQGLTDEETNEIARQWQETPDGLGDLCRAIEAKLKEKNNG